MSASPSCRPASGLADDRVAVRRQRAGCPPTRHVVADAVRPRRAASLLRATVVPASARHRVLGRGRPLHQRVLRLLPVDRPRRGHDRVPRQTTSSRPAARTRGRRLRVCWWPWSGRSFVAQSSRVADYAWPDEVVASLGANGSDWLRLPTRAVGASLPLIGAGRRAQLALYPGTMLLFLAYLGLAGARRSQLRWLVAMLVLGTERGTLGIRTRPRRLRRRAVTRSFVTTWPASGACGARSAGRCSHRCASRCSRVQASMRCGGGAGGGGLRLPSCSRRSP